MNVRAPVAVVGAGGFIGRALVTRLLSQKVPVAAVVRRPVTFAQPVKVCPLGDLCANTDWAPVFAGVAGVVHLAGRAHAPMAASDDWIETETEAARHLAASAVRAGVDRLILVSSIKVHGERSVRPFRADDPLAPADPYAVAKARIESVMSAAVAGGGTSLAIIRPPLVYGPRVKANFLALLGLVNRAPALPFGTLANRRSLLYIENLVDLVERVLSRPERASGAFLARDDEDLSISELVRRIGRHLGHQPLLVPCPLFLLNGLARAIGRAGAVGRLGSALQVDDRPTRAALAWRPPVNLDDGLAATCRWFLDAARDRA